MNGWICIRECNNRWWVTEEQDVPPQPLSVMIDRYFSSYGEALFYAHDIAEKGQLVSFFGDREEWDTLEEAEKQRRLQQ